MHALLNLPREEAGIFFYEFMHVCLNLQRVNLLLEFYIWKEIFYKDMVDIFYLLSTGP